MEVEDKKVTVLATENLILLTQEPDSIVTRTEQTNYSEQEEIARNNSEINIIAKHTNNIKSPIKFWSISHKPEINKLLL